MFKKLSTISISLSLLFAFGALSVSAQQPPSIGNPGCDSTICIENPFSGGDSLAELLETIINDILLPFGGVAAVLAFIYSGFLYVTAQGNEAKIATAHKALLYTVIGTALLLGAWMLAQVVCNTIGQLGGPTCPT